VGSPVWAQGRLATIDLKKVFDTYYKTKQASATLKDHADDMEKEHKNMLEDWKKAKEDYQTLLAGANDQAVSAEEREKRKKSAEEKLKFIKETEEGIVAFEKKARATLDQQQLRMRENILGEIRTVLSSKAKTAGFSMVIDTAAEGIQNTPIVLYNNNDNDLTDAVLNQLNATSPSEPAKTDEKKNDKKSGK
jgi:Skp family chaperone for outer membrane proteins